MIQHLLSHGFKNYFRSPVWGKSLAVNIILGLLALYMLSMILLIGIFLLEVVEQIAPDSDPLFVVNGIVLYYFGAEFLLRFFLQNTPVLFIQPYLHLPLKKGRIIHFMLRKSFLSAFNLIAIFLFLPFTIRYLIPEVGATAAFGWMGTLFGLVVLNHYFGLYFKKKLNEVPNLIFILFGTMIGLWLLDYFQLVQFSLVSAWFMDQFINQPILALVPILIGLGFYRANYQFLRNNTYPEEISTKKASSKIRGDFGFLKKFGRVGELIAVELKLILRHKRPRNTLVLSGLLLGYGLIFYPNETYQEMSWIFVFVGVFITGLFFINHGQFLLSWQSGHFDFILTQKLNVKEYLESKYWMFVASCSVAFVISLAYAYFGWKIALINFCAFLFNIGINIPIVMRLSMFNPKKIDLNRGAAFNYEGVGAAQWLMIFPVLLAPYALYAPLLVLGYEIAGILAVGLVGLIGFVFHKRVLHLLTQNLINKRHKISAGFRAQ